MSVNPKELVREFLLTVRSGRHPEAADQFMATTVLAHQIVSEETLDITRTPDQYRDHVLEMKAEYGDFEFEIDELIAEGDRVYARWQQLGRGVRAVTSCVYRVENDRIVEYWIQIDRKGIELQSNPQG